jgi:putative tricarboxylic transport membrane protein
MGRLAPGLLLPLLFSTVAVSGQPAYDHLRIIAPAAPGGGWDQTARAMQQALHTAGIVSSASVENIAGAAGTIGLARVIGAERGAPNVVMVSGLIMLGAVVTHRSPVTLSDVTPIARLTGEYEAIVVPAQSPYRTLGALLEAFRARPESISWGGGSAGGTDQILAGLVADAVGVSPRRVNYIAFAGGGEAVAALLGAQAAAGISGYGEFQPHIESGKLRAIALSAPARISGIDVPTIREQGVNVELGNWRGVVAPAGLTATDRKALLDTVDALAKSASWKAELRKHSWEDAYLAGDRFAAYLRTSNEAVARVLKEVGLVK